MRENTICGREAGGLPACLPRSPVVLLYIISRLSVRGTTTDDLELSASV